MWFLGAIGAWAGLWSGFEPPLDDPSSPPPAHFGPVVSWQADETCPDLAALHGRIEQALGGELAGAAVQELPVRARVTRGETGLALTLEIGGGDQVEVTRAQASQCDVLADLVALKVALALDPLQATGTVMAEPEDPEPEPETQEPEPEPVLTPKPPTPSTTGPPLAGGTPPARPRRVKLVVRTGTDVGVGLLNIVDLGGFLGLGAKGRAWQAEATMRLRGSPPVTSDALAPGQVNLLYTGGTVSGCFLSGAQAIAVPLCGVFESGMMRAQGVDLAASGTAWRPYIGAGAETGVSWPRDNWIRLSVRAGASAGLLRPRFHVDGVGEVHRVDPVAARVLIGVEFVAQRKGSAGLTAWTPR